MGVAERFCGCWCPEEKAPLRILEHGLEPIREALPVESRRGEVALVTWGVVSEHTCGGSLTWLGTPSRPTSLISESKRRSYASAPTPAPSVHGGGRPASPDPPALPPLPRRGGPPRSPCQQRFSGRHVISPPPS